jgi:hypothetical protein
MSDRFADTNAAYREALARAEAGAVEVPGETTVETVLAELDGAVPVVEEHVEQAEPVVETDNSEVVPEVPVTPAEAVEGAAVEKLLAGNFKTAEELERAYVELRALEGRRGQETGELRKAVDELRTQLATPAPQQAPLVDISEDLIMRDPARATMLAFNQKDETGLSLAFEAWRMEDPFSSGQWLSERRAEQREEAHKAELDSIRSEVTKLSVPQAEAAQREEWNQAFSIVSAKSPDFSTHAARILEEVAPQYPNILGALSSGDAKAKAEILTALYAIDRAQTEDPAKLRETLNEEARQAAEEVRQAKDGAKVLSQVTTGGDAPEQSWEEAEAARFNARNKQKQTSFERNWTGRKSE